MKTLEIDIETYSSVNLNKCGVYKYAESPDFEILLFGYSIDGGPVQVVDLACGEILPEEVLRALTDDSVIKWAYNAQFERICLSRYICDIDKEIEQKYGFDSGIGYLNPVSWRCSMIWSAYLGLPFSLEGVGTILGLEKQKLSEGKELIKYFCGPCAPTKTNGGRTRNLPDHDTGKWERFKSYNKRDVEVEIQIQNRLVKYPVPDFIWEEYHIDQEINDRGIRTDKTLVERAIELDERTHSRIDKRLMELTGIDNPNSVLQMRDWLLEHGVETDSIDKKAVKTILESIDDPTVKEVLILRQQISKSAVKKYQSMANVACEDNRCHGMFQFYGANRTGRWSGRIVQLQNLRQNHISELEDTRELVRAGDYEAIELLYDDVPEVLGQLVRTAFIPSEGMRLFVADFSAIEARVIAWLAGEKWRTQAFIEGKDIYCASASAMFHVNVVKHGENGHLRQRGKIAELALGYGGSVGALTAMGAPEMGIAEDELQPLVDAWRKANPCIVRFWWEIGNAVMKAVKEKATMTVKEIRIWCQSGMLFIRLPSGRTLSYVKPRIGENRFGGESVTYEEAGATKKWERTESYGPKFVENIIQGISRDILMNSMRTLRNFRIVGHVHDELIIEAPAETSLEELCKQMATVPEWAPGLILRADGYICDFYRKD